MAYSTSNPPKLLVQSVGGSGASLWALTGTDADTAVDASGYISNAKSLGMKAGDIVFYTKTDASPIANFMLNVTSVNATTGAADLSNSTTVTATNSD